jgi:hypothetical protein
MAATHPPAETQFRARPPLWPVLCSAVLVGIVIASEIPSAGRPSATRTGPATGAFGAARSSDEPAATQHKRAQEVGRGVTPRPLADNRPRRRVSLAQLPGEALGKCAVGAVFGAGHNSMRWNLVATSVLHDTGRDALAPVLASARWGTFGLPNGCPTSNQKAGAMNGKPKKQEPEIMPPVPDVEPEQNIPEIPPDKDAPEKKGPIQAEV